MEGTVKFFNRSKGFGFIQGDDSNDYFVHFTAVARGTFLRDNDRVSFDSAEGDRGLKAENVTLLQKASEMEGGAQEQESHDEPAQEEETQEQEAQPEEPAQEEEQPAEESAPEEESSEDSAEEKQEE